MCYKMIFNYSKFVCMFLAFWYVIKANGNKLRSVKFSAFSWEEDEMKIEIEYTLPQYIKPIMLEEEICDNWEVFEMLTQRKST